MLQSKNRTRKARRQELGMYKRLVKLLDSNINLVTQRGLYWKDQFESSQAAVRSLQAAVASQRNQLAQKPSGLILGANGRLIT